MEHVFGRVMSTSINVFCDYHMQDLVAHLKHIPNVVICPTMNINVDYYFGRHCSHLPAPRMGFVICGNDVSRDMTGFDLEEQLNVDGNNYFFYRSKVNASETPAHDDVTFVIQGYDNTNMVNSTCICFLYGHVVVSSWQKYNSMQVVQAIMHKNVFNRQNIYYQVFTTLNGLLRSKTTFAIKLRSDELFVDWSSFINKMKDNPEKLVCTNIYLRHVINYAFHCSDHVIGGTCSNMLAMFKGAESIILENKHYRRPFSNCRWVPEQVLTIGFLTSLYDWDSLRMHTCPDLMKKHFTSVDISEFKDFVIVYSKKTTSGRVIKAVVRPDNLHYHRKTIVECESIECLEYKQ